MSTKTLAPVSIRQKEIVKEYLLQVEKHIGDLRNGLAERTHEIRDFADLMHVHPTHLSNTISQVTGKSPCDIYEHKLIDLAKELLISSNRPVAQIARQLDFDPSNFTKFFKIYQGTTPKRFREENWALKI